MSNGAAGVPRGVIVLLGLVGAVVTVAGLKTVSHIIGPVSGPDADRHRKPAERLAAPARRSARAAAQGGPAPGVVGALPSPTSAGSQPA
jgi:hypothetical protein